MNGGSKNVAFIHGDFPFGGAEKVTLDIAGYIAPAGYKVYIFAASFREDMMPAGGSYPVEVLILPHRDVVHSKKDAEFIRDKALELGIRIIVPVARRLRHIGIIRENGIRIVYAHHNMPFHEARAYIDRAWAKGTRSPLRFLEWLLISYPKYVIFGEAKRREMKFYKGSYDECDRYVMLCGEYRDEIVTRLGLDPENNKVRVIENYQKLPEKINCSKRDIILYSGRLSYPDKRLDRLVDAWSLVCNRLPGWKVLIVGEGKDRKNIERRIKRKKVPGIFLEGYSNDVQKYYDEASVLALVSTYEGWPLCLTEAQANGVIPVVFDSFAAVGHIVGHSGKYGFAVKPFDINAFAGALYKAATMPEEDKLKMRKDIIGKVRTEFTMEECGEKWKKLFDELI